MIMHRSTVCTILYTSVCVKRDLGRLHVSSTIADKANVLAVMLADDAFKEVARRSSVFVSRATSARSVS